MILKKVAILMILMGLSSAVHAAELHSTYKVRIGQQSMPNLELCYEMLQIINLPENTGTKDVQQNFGKELVIPSQYKNFKMTTWEAISAEELSKYIYSPETIKRFFLLKKRNLQDKRWDGNGDYIYEKTLINFDNFGSNEANNYMKYAEDRYKDSGASGLKAIRQAQAFVKEAQEKKVVLRYRLPNWTQWNCQLPDDMPLRYTQEFNLLEKGTMGNPRSEDCQLFTYKGRTYVVSRWAHWIDVYKPNGRLGSATNGESFLYDQNICSYTKYY